MDAEILADLEPCGYVLATNGYKYFALQCIYCNEKYGHWTTFMRHLRERHTREEANIIEDEESESSLLFQDEDENEVCEKLVIELTKDEAEFEVEEENDIQEESEKLADTAEFAYKYEDTEISMDCLDQQSDAGTLPDSNLFVDFKVNFSATTSLFIELYKRHPCLWDSDHLQYGIDAKRRLAKRAMINDLTRSNISVSLIDLNKNIQSIHKLFHEITKRLATKQEVSTSELEWYKQCSFLQLPSTSNALNVDETLEGQQQLNSTDSESSLSEFALSDKDDDESDAKQSNKNKPTCEFIDCYRQQPCLWDPESPDYYNSEERSKALMKISTFFKDNYNATLTQRRLNAAIKRLHAFYKRFCYSRRQISSIRKSYYESCAFLSGIELDDKIQITNISSNKISFGQTDQFTLGFIDVCANHPVLWDSNHQYYSIFTERKKAYDEMSQQLQQRYSVSFNKEELCDSINRLKQYYYNIHDRERKNEPLTKSDLIYLERCKYLPACKRRVQCDICERMLRSSTTLQVHLLKEHNVGQLPLKCGYCELRFANRHGLREHEVRAHTKDFEWFCQHCNKGFASRRDMETHELVHTGERNCVCEHCGKGFRLKQQMKEHVRVVHERVRQFKCSMCPKDYLRKTHLEDHIRGHLNIRDKICPTCGKAFTNFHSLFRHKQLHSEVKRYICKVCGECFHQFVGLNGHMKRKHKIVKDLNAIVEPTSTEYTSEAPATEA